MRWTQPLLVLLVISACTKRLPVPEGDIAGALASAVPIDDIPFDPSSILGKPTLVMFVSPTCEHCLAELPRAQAVVKEVDANIVAVFVLGKKANAEAVAKSTSFEGEVLVDDGTLRKKYDITGVPYTLILKRDGHAVTALRGEQDESAIRDALADAR